jgi:V8-like Glu-specific endopeptidase
MTDPRQLIAFAKRVFPERDVAAERAHRIADQLAGDEVPRLGIAAMRPAVMPARAPADLSGSIRAGADALAKLDQLAGDELRPEVQIGIEAIIILVGRPALLVQDGDFAPAGEMWEPKLAPNRAAIRDALARVGRIELRGHPTYPWVGTGFMVAPGVIMTNRHVAVTFTRETASGYRFLPGVTSRIDFREEYQREAAEELAIKSVIGIHPRYDLALLRAEASDKLPKPLAVSAQPPAATKDYDVVVIGYPAYDSRNDAREMVRIFDNIFNVKRLQPGALTGTFKDAAGATIIGHDCSTLGGNSGSAVYDFRNRCVVGLHFGGRYLEGNSAVPLWTLFGDELLKKARVTFV